MSHLPAFALDCPQSSAYYSCMKKGVNIRISSELAKAVADVAWAEDRSLNNAVIRLIKEALKKRGVPLTKESQ